MLTRTQIKKVSRLQSQLGSTELRRASKPSPTASLIAAGEALRKAVGYSIGNSGHWSDPGLFKLGVLSQGSDDQKAKFCTSLATTIEGGIEDAIAAWNKAKRAAGASGKGK